MSGELPVDRGVVAVQIQCLTYFIGCAKYILLSVLNDAAGVGVTQGWWSASSGCISEASVIKITLPPSSYGGRVGSNNLGGRDRTVPIQHELDGVFTVTKI